MVQSDILGEKYVRINIYDEYWKRNGKIAKHINIPDEYRIVCILPVGKPDEEIHHTAKKTLKAGRGLMDLVKIIDYKFHLVRETGWDLWKEWY